MNGTEFPPLPHDQPHAGQGELSEWAERAALLENQQSTEAKAYAGFWVRFAAGTVDLILRIILGFCAGIVLGIAAPIVVLPAALTFDWLYFAVQESGSHPATFGKRACGIIVTDSAGKRILFGRATGRFFGKLLSSIFCIGFIMVAFTSKKQGLHDFLADTVVVHRTS